MVSSIKILVVDDDQVDRQAIIRGLTKIDSELEIFEADDGKTACSILKHNTIDILITDYNMPSQNGLDLCCAFYEQKNNIISYIVLGYLSQNLTDHYSKKAYLEVLS